MGSTTSAHGLPARAGARCAPRPSRAPLLLLLFWAVCLLLAGLPAPAAAGVDDHIAATLRQAGLDGVSTGVYVWDLDAALPVFEHNATTELTPASNVKLATSAAALLDWGAGHRFATELYVPDVAVAADGSLYGNVYLRGLGDPTLSTRSYQREVLGMTTASFETLARALRREGIRKIRGRVLGDASWFDKLKTVPTWGAGLQLDCGPISALSGDQGLDDGNRVRAPATWAASLMTKACAKAGITVAGKPGTGRVPATARLLKRQYSAALPRVLRHMNSESDNFFAEMVCKGLGRDFHDEGSTRAGAVVIEAALHAMGVKTGTYVIQDGSGLSYGNRLTALGLVKVLGAMRQRNDFDAYYDSLAIAGRDGTLEDRMRGTAAAGNARAKTGTLNVAVSLSGYVESANDHLAAFSIIVNGNSVGTAGWEAVTKAEDAVVATLASATLPGDPVLAATPVLRAFSISATEPVHGAGGLLKPGVQP